MRLGRSCMCDTRWQEANGSAFILFRPEEPNSGYKELEAAFLEAAQQQADVAGLFPGPPNTHTRLHRILSLVYTLCSVLELPPCLCLRGPNPLSHTPDIGSRPPKRQERGS